MTENKPIRILDGTKEQYQKMLVDIEKLLKSIA